MCCNFGPCPIKWLMGLVRKDPFSGHGRRPGQSQPVSFYQNVGRGCRSSFFSDTIKSFHKPPYNQFCFVEQLNAGHYRCWEAGIYSVTAIYGSNGIRILLFCHHLKSRGYWLVVVI